MPVLTYAEAVRGREDRPVVPNTAGHRAVHMSRSPVLTPAQGFYQCAASTMVWSYTTNVLNEYI